MNRVQQMNYIMLHGSLRPCMKFRIIFSLKLLAYGFIQQGIDFFVSKCLSITH